MNTICESFEDPESCVDCRGACNYDGTCESFESVTCGDCGGCDVDTVCEPGEPASCPDCA